MDKVSTKSVLLLTLSFLHKDHPHHKARLGLSRADPTDNPQLLLGFHISPDPLPLLLVVGDGPLAYGGIIRDSKPELELIHSPNRIPKYQPMLQRQEVLVVPLPFPFGYYPQIQGFELSVPKIVPLNTPVLPP